MNHQPESRTLFDWTIFALVHLIVVGGIAVAGFWIYGFGLGVWVAISATVAGLALTHLHKVEVPGETLMRVLIYLFASLNAGYLVHNGAKVIGVESYNAAQVQKYGAGMTGAAKAGSVKVARTLGASAKDASELAKVFDNEVAVIASIFAFLELFTALVVLSLASRRTLAQKVITQGAQEPVSKDVDFEPFEWGDEREEASNGHRRSKAHR